MQRPPFDCIALLLQGGGAMGAYQGGVYQALAEAKLHPDWVAGISIGAINSAIIAGNAPEQRVDRLRAFWELVSAPAGGALAAAWFGNFLGTAGDAIHGVADQLSAAHVMMHGVPGFFSPRFPPPWLSSAGSDAATSFYDTKALRATLESLIDFDRINAGEMGLSVGAVNVRTGNFTYFDNETQPIRPEHVMASGALPPGFPAIEIDGEHYWDGGLVSNTPLQWLVDSEPRRDTLAFQVDLWSARGDFPADLTAVAIRQKEIQFSSRTRAGGDKLKELQKIRGELAQLLERLPPDLKASPEIAHLAQFSDPKVYNVVQLIYRSKTYEGNTMDYEFSRSSMEDHWNAGYDDALRALSHKRIFARPDRADGYFSFDFAEADPTAK
jgi:NTE family protein